MANDMIYKQLGIQNVFTARFKGFANKTYVRRILTVLIKEIFMKLNHFLLNLIQYKNKNHF